MDSAAASFAQAAAVSDDCDEEPSTTPPEAVTSGARTGDRTLTRTTRGESISMADGCEWSIAARARGVVSHASSPPLHCQSEWRDSAAQRERAVRVQAAITHVRAYLFPFVVCSVCCECVRVSRVRAREARARRVELAEELRFRARAHDGSAAAPKPTEDEPVQRAGRTGGTGGGHKQTCTSQSLLRPPPSCTEAPPPTPTPYRHILPRATA